MREQITKQVMKIRENPLVGKPMRYGRKGTREIYIGSYRLSYCYMAADDVVQIIVLYHKDEQ